MRLESDVFSFWLPLLILIIIMLFAIYKKDEILPKDFHKNSVKYTIGG